MPCQYPRGSEWRVWDLHIHSPSSIVQCYGGDQPKVWEQFLSALESLPNDVKVIGINDYYFIDGYERVMYEKLHNGRLNNISKVFPIIEFRIDTFGAASASSLSKINLHILFDLDEGCLPSEIKKVKEEFIGQIKVSKQFATTPLSKNNLIAKSPEGNLKSGFSELIPSTEEVYKLIESDTWKNKIVLFLGYSEWHTLDKGKQLKLVKEDLYNRAHFFFTASVADCTSKKEEVLSAYGTRKLIHSLDIHNFDNFINYKCLTWIKADPTFDGLRHVFVESASRLFIGEKPPKKVSIEKDRYLFIDALNITSNSDDMEWFDRTGKVLFNAGLNVIIGNKGTGKSALADMIGLTGNCHTGNYSFLTPSKFLALKAHKKYSAEITFRDNYTNTRIFHDAMPDLQKESKVVFLSQSFVNELCESEEGIEALQAEIDRVIFSHIPKEYTLAQSDLRELISVRAKRHNDLHAEYCKKIEEINSKIVQLEDMLTDTYRATIKNRLDERMRQLSEIISNEKPLEITAPEDTASARVIFLSTKYSAILQQLKAKLDSVQTDLNAKEISVQKINEILSDLELLISSSTRISEKIAKESSLSDIDTKSIFHLQINKEPLLIAVDKLQKSNDNLRVYKLRCNKLIDNIVIFLTKQAESLSEKQKNYKEYLEAKEKWLEKQRLLQGGVDTPDTIIYLKEHIRQIDTVYRDQLKEMNIIRDEIAENIIENINKREQGLADIYSFVQAEADKLARGYEIPRNEFVVFDISTSLCPSFADDFLAYINQNRTGTFYRVDEGRIVLNKLLQTVLSARPNQLNLVPGVLLPALKHNLAADPEIKDNKYETEIENQISSKKTKLQLYNYLYTFDYLQSRFMLTYDSKPLHLLSPGEKGILLLIFFLLVDKSRVPIVIDQPEENLDNETVYRRLVSIIKNCKEHRQLIIVTHNPNLAVVCDAEQVICCTMDKVNGNQINYTTGSLENQAQKDAILRVLEGTRPAFDNRQCKYDI